MKTTACIILAAGLLSVSVHGKSPAPVVIPDNSAYILTPKPGPEPRINGARIFGARPGSQFLFNIAASGERPMSFSAVGLPEGLSLDTSTGQITGRTEAIGTHTVEVTATNNYGSANRTLRIVIGDKIALTPPMGWNSWNCWGRDVTQEQVLSSARAMHDKRLIDHGWSYINIDDGWQGMRGGKYNAIQPNDKFPDMQALTSEVHALGLKLGIYSSPWVGTYAAHIGSYADTTDGQYHWIQEGNCNENYRLQLPGGNYMKDRKRVRYHSQYSFVENDARQWADWEIDYLKYDWKPNDVAHIKEMYEALRNTSRDIVYSLSNNAPLANAPMLVEYADAWRTTGDIRDNWDNFSKIGFSQDRWAPYAGPGHWPDADMLVVGLVGWGPKLHYTNLTPDEQYTHMTLWSILASPLLIGCDLARIDDFTLSLLTNDEVIDVNQDPLGYHGAPLVNNDEEAVYIKPLEDGYMAIALFNKTLDPRQITIDLKKLGFYVDQHLRDLWRQKDVEMNGHKYTATVAPHGANMYRIYPGNTL